MTTIAQQIVQGLVDIQAISINTEEPFIWASKIKAPIYCDNRKSLGHYELRAKIAQGLVELTCSEFPDVDLIGGTATAGIPHATSVADQLKLPLVYFRSKPKDHGTGSVIEGDFQPRQKIVIVEDLISTGGSVLQCVDYAQKAGLEVLGVVAIFTYQLAIAQQNFTQLGVKLNALAGFPELSDVLKLSTNQRAFLEQWRQDPKDESVWLK